MSVSLSPIQYQCQCRQHTTLASFGCLATVWGASHYRLPSSPLPHPPHRCIVVLFHSNTGTCEMVERVFVCVNRCVRALLVRKSKLMLMPRAARDGQTEPRYINHCEMRRCWRWRWWYAALSLRPEYHEKFSSLENGVFEVYHSYIEPLLFICTCFWMRMMIAGYGMVSRDSWLLMLGWTGWRGV